MKHTQKNPHYVILPKGSVSPTNSIYKTHDIVKQGRVLWSESGARTLRSSEPFVVSVKVGNKVRNISSRVK